jgi:hypothetical protein
LLLMSSMAGRAPASLHAYRRSGASE